MCSWRQRAKGERSATSTMRRPGSTLSILTVHATATGSGRALLTDRVTYRLRGGRLGALAGRLVGRRLEAAFSERHRRTRELLEA